MTGPVQGVGGTTTNVRLRLKQKDVWLTRSGHHSCWYWKRLVRQLDVVNRDKTRVVVVVVVMEVVHRYRYIGRTMESQPWPQGLYGVR